MQQHPIHILEQYWNFTQFKPLQEEIINAVIAGDDVLALLPTGGGKSLCFQIPALCKEGLCIVVSPLLALMQNQVQALQNKGIKALTIPSGIAYQDLDVLLDNCIYGNYKFLYLSPERLQQSLVQDRIEKMNVNLIAVDEAHCISQWGNDFRPSYSNIVLLRQLKPHANCIALTASATPRVITDIKEKLDFIASKTFKNSFARPNLAYMVLEEEDKYYQLKYILNKHKASSIIYVRSRNLTKKIAAYLNTNNLKATYYNGGLTASEKEDNMRDWLDNRKPIMVATNAFGMGIDKPDVATVIHINLPESIESYFQEAGRAGRNGNKAYAILLKNENDKPLLEQQFLSHLASVKDVKLVYKKLSNYFQIAYGEGEFSTHYFNLNTFCNNYKLPLYTTYNAIQILDRNSILKISNTFFKRTKVQFLVTNADLFSYLENNTHAEVVVKTMLRTYGGIFEQETAINTNLIAAKAALEETTIISELKQLESDAIIRLKIKTTDAELTFLVPREDDSTINAIAPSIKQQNLWKQKQVAAMLNYVENNTTCRSIQLLSYFGDETAEKCGICSVCLKEKETKTIATEKLENNIEKTLLKNGALTSRQLVEYTKASKKEVLKAIQYLLESKKITLTPTNSYKISTSIKK